MYIYLLPRCLALGSVPSPFDCYLCNRGLKTLPLRMKQHFSNALAAARFLEADPRVDKVIFPGECSDTASPLFIKTHGLTRIIYNKNNNITKETNKQKKPQHGL